MVEDSYLQQTYFEYGTNVKIPSEIKPPFWTASDWQVISQHQLEFNSIYPDEGCYDLTFEYITSVSKKPGQTIVLLLSSMTQLLSLTIAHCYFKIAFRNDSTIDFKQTPRTSEWNGIILNLYSFVVDRACSKLAETAWDAGTGRSCRRQGCHAAVPPLTKVARRAQHAAGDTTWSADLQFCLNTAALPANYSCCRTYTHAAVSWGACMGHNTFRLMLHDADGIISTLTRG